MKSIKEAIRSIHDEHVIKLKQAIKAENTHEDFAIMICTQAINKTQGAFEVLEFSKRRISYKTLKQVMQYHDKIVHFWTSERAKHVIAKAKRTIKTIKGDN